MYLTKHKRISVINKPNDTTLEIKAVGATGGSTFSFSIFSRTVQFPIYTEFNGVQYEIIPEVISQDFIIYSGSLNLDDEHEGKIFGEGLGHMYYFNDSSLYGFFDIDIKRFKNLEKYSNFDNTYSKNQNGIDKYSNVDSISLIDSSGSNDQNFIGNIAMLNNIKAFRYSCSATSQKGLSGWFQNNLKPVFIHIDAANSEIKFDAKYVFNNALMCFKYNTLHNSRALVDAILNKLANDVDTLLPNIYYEENFMNEDDSNIIDMRSKFKRTSASNSAVAYLQNLGFLILN